MWVSSLDISGQNPWSFSLLHVYLVIYWQIIQFFVVSKVSSPSIDLFDKCWNKYHNWWNYFFQSNKYILETFGQSAVSGNWLHFKVIIYTFICFFLLAINLCQEASKTVTEEFLSCSGFSRGNLRRLVTCMLHVDGFMGILC